MTRDMVALMGRIKAGEIETRWTPDPDPSYPGSFYWKVVGGTEKVQRDINRLWLDGFAKFGPNTSRDLKPVVLTAAGRAAFADATSGRKQKNEGDPDA